MVHLPYQFPFQQVDRPRHGLGLGRRVSGNVDAGMALNGTLAGLVAVTAALNIRLDSA
jgi:hypothetical protein